MSRFIPLLTLIAVGALALASAAQDGAKVDIRGKVTKFSVVKPNNAGILASVMVEGKKENSNYDKAAVKITNKTKLEKLVGKERRPATLEDLKEGVQVEAKFTGPVLQSYPVQATAAEVLIVEPARK
jgi:hypothetical protein